MINIVKNGKTLDLKAISGKVPINSGDKIVITESGGKYSPKKLITKQVEKDLLIFEEGIEKPSVILENYYESDLRADLSGIDNNPYLISESGNSLDLLIEPLDAPAAGGAVAATSALAGGTTAGLSTMSMIGLGGLGIAGVAATTIAVENSSKKESSPAPIVLDTTSPSATITLSNTTLKAGDTTTVTITFSEAVKNFSNDDLTIANGILSTLTTTNNITWTATFTPNTDIENTTNVITLANTYTDTAGNTGTNADSGNYVIDTLVPVITSAISQTIDENIQSGTIIYTATATDGNSVTYSLSGADESLLSINSTTGAIRLFNIIDYETKSSYSFTIIATDAAGNVSEEAINLEINNLDEIAPTITSNTTAPTINENSGSGQVIYSTTSTDSADIAIGSIAYSLKSTGDYTLLNIDSTTGAVSLISNPDFDTKSSYSFTVIATDAAGNVSEKSVSFNILNLDEVTPTITSGATGSVEENAAVSTVIYTLSATDTVDISAGVTYSLSGADASLLHLNSMSGEVTLIASADYEAKSNYSFSVIADDGQNTPTTKDVFISVTNIDEVAPTLTSSNTAANINENTGTGQLIYTTASTDTVDITTGSTTYSLKSTGDYTLLSIDSTTGEVTLLSNPNCETKSSYNFIVVATDNAGNASEQLVVLAVNNLDEVAPTITSSTTATNINENSGAGQVIYTATSTDTADTATGSTSYSLKNIGDYNLLSINATTGAVTLTANPDYETKNNYSFTVIATDAANNATEKAITLAINDLDEIAPNIPTLSLATDSGTINNDGKTNVSTININGLEAGATWEYRVDLGSWIYGNGTSFNAVEGAHSYQARQTDASGNISNIFADLLVTLDTSAPIAPTLTLATDSGTINSDGITNISTINVVGLEGSSPWEYSIDGGSWLSGSGNSFNATNSTHTYTARQSDISGNISTQSSTVTITLDTAIPAFSSASSINSDENTPTSSVVYDANANDANTLTYSLAGGADANLFNINTYTGEVTFKTSPDYEIPTDNGANNIYDFTIRATDTAGNTADKAVQLNVNNLIETSIAPTATILIGDTALKIGETTSVFIVFNKAVTNFTNDDVVVANGILSALTTTDNITWSATLATTNNIEDTTNVITLNTTYTDTIGNAGTSATSGNYMVDTIAPIFTSANTINVNENSTVIMNAVAVGALSYSLVDVSGATDVMMDIDPSTGSIRFLNSPDYENPVDIDHNNNYHVIARATDSAGNTTDQWITININNMDEIAPVFTSGTSASVVENTSTSTVVYTAAATDANTIAYTISGTDAALFDLNSTTGAVTFKTSPNYEAPTDNGANNIYNFNVTATDIAGNFTDKSVALSVTNLSEVTLGQSVIDLGGYGKLIAPVNVGGNWYYFWDMSGDGSADYSDWNTHNFLDGLFTKDSAGQTGGYGNTDNTYRYATLNGINVALPTMGDGTTLLYDDKQMTNFSTDYAAIFNTSYAPSGWIDYGYWTSTPSIYNAPYGHATVDSSSSYSSVYAFETDMAFVALQVLG